MMIGLGLLGVFLPFVLSDETFFEGDILLSNKPQSPSTLEMVLANPTFRWPRGVVPYAFDDLSEFSEASKEIVRDSMEGIHSKTGCITFKEVDRSRGGDIVIITAFGLGTQAGRG